MRGGLIAWALAGTVACDPARLAAQQAADLIPRTAAAFAQESDVELARAAAPSGLKQLEGFYLVAGPRRPLLLALAEGFCGWGAGFVHDEWEREVFAGGDGQEPLASARRALGRCARYAAMALPPQLASLFDDDAAGSPPVAQRLAAARPRDALPLYYLATAYAALLGMTAQTPRAGGTPELGLLARLPTVLAVLRRVNELEPALAHGQAHALYGSLLAQLPVFGDLDEAERQFTAARAVTSGRLLLVDVLAARALAVARGDRAAFRALLGRALATSPAALPEARLVNELAQRAARRLLRSEARFFPAAAAR